MSLLLLLRKRGTTVTPPSTGTGPVALSPGRGFWRFVVCDVAGVSIGEVTRGRTFSFGVSRTDTATFQVHDKESLWGEVAADGKHTLKVYDTSGALRLFGPIVTEDEQDGPATFAAADLSWRFGRRFFVKDATGIGRTYTTQDPAVIAYDGLSRINANSDTGVAAGNSETFVARTITYLWKNYLQALNELGAIAGSYEWTLRYVDGVLGGTPACYLDLLTTLGDDRSGDVFVEYGFGKHDLTGYRRVKTIERLATRVFALGSGGTQTAEVYDPGAETDLGTRYEDVISVADITVAALVDAVATAHVAIRKAPRETFELPIYAKLAPRYGVDYVKGDRITARVKKNGLVRANGSVRVWAGQITITDNGEEQPTLTLDPS